MSRSKHLNFDEMMAAEPEEVIHLDSMKIGEQLELGQYVGPFIGWDTSTPMFEFESGVYATTVSELADIFRSGRPGDRLTIKCRTMGYIVSGHRILESGFVVVGEEIEPMDTRDIFKSKQVKRYFKALEAAEAVRHLKRKQK